MQSVCHQSHSVLKNKHTVLQTDQLYSDHFVSDLCCYECYLLLVQKKANRSRINKRLNSFISYNKSNENISKVEHYCFIYAFLIECPEFVL